MYEIIFYEDKRGKSNILEYTNALLAKSLKSKDARIQYEQIVLTIELLQNKGTALPEKYSKHIDDGIWEIRPGHNRILYFWVCKEKIVLLHLFRKKTQKTPRREIEKAKTEREDYLTRKEMGHDNLG